jgi:hypothetical protein
MVNKKYRFVTVFTVMLLLLGLTLAACGTPTPTTTPPTEQPAAPPTEQPAAPPTEQPAAPPTEQPAAPPALTYKAATYTNSEYGFSIQYPSDWVARPEIAVGTIIAAFGVPGFVPGVSLSVRDANEPLTAEWIIAANTDEGNTDVKVTSDITPTTLDDGTPAFQYTSTFTSQGYEIASFATSVDKDGKRIRATVWTITAFSPYDETLFPEIAHTLSVK